MNRHQTRVRDVLSIYQDKGLSGLEEYFKNPNVVVDPSTWVNNIKTSLEEGHKLSVEMEINLVLEKLMLG